MASVDGKTDRVRQMLLDTGQTWDLSPNDKEALRHVLGLINSMAWEIAESTGQPIPTVIGRHEAIVSSGDQSA